MAILRERTENHWALPCSPDGNTDFWAPERPERDRWHTPVGPGPRLLPSVDSLSGERRPLGVAAHPEPQGFFEQVHTHMVMPLVVAAYWLVPTQETLCGSNRSPLLCCSGRPIGSVSESEAVVMIFAAPSACSGPSGRRRRLPTRGPLPAGHRRPLVQRASRVCAGLPRLGSLGLERPSRSQLPHRGERRSDAPRSVG